MDLLHVRGGRNEQRSKHHRVVAGPDDVVIVRPETRPLVIDCPAELDRDGGADSSLIGPRFEPYHRLVDVG